MGVIVLTETTDIPITLIGELSGICYGADTKNHDRNYKRGLDCIKKNHGRTLEFPQVYLKITGYSARVVREFGRHTGGLPSYLQASTRYINYENFDFIIPPNIPETAKTIYQSAIQQTKDNMKALSEQGVPKEDIAMLLPLGMTTNLVWRGNLRVLVDMSRQRLCTRAYWEFRQLFKDIMDSLAFYSDEWKIIVEELKLFKPKCQVLGYCPEGNKQLCKIKEG